MKTKIKVLLVIFLLIPNLTNAMECRSVKYNKVNVPENINYLENMFMKDELKKTSKYYKLIFVNILLVKLWCETIY